MLPKAISVKPTMGVLKEYVLRVHFKGTKGITCNTYLKVGSQEYLV